MAAFALMGALHRALGLREDYQAYPAFAKKPGRCLLRPGLDSLWLLSQSDQALRLHHCDRGMHQTLDPLAPFDMTDDCHQTTWGTREGADADDNIRMLPIPPMATITPPMTPPPGGRVLRERGAGFPMMN
jgi:hypothetical protein